MSDLTYLVDVPGVAAPTTPYSPGVIAGGWCVVSCQLAVDPATGRLVDGDIDVQAPAALDRVAAVLRAAGADWPSVVSVTVLLAQQSDARPFDDHYRRRWPAGGPYPARAIYQAGALAPGALVGVAATALSGPSR